MKSANQTDQHCPLVVAARAMILAGDYDMSDDPKHEAREDFAKLVNVDRIVSNSAVSVAFDLIRQEHKETKAKILDLDDQAKALQEEKIALVKHSYHLASFLL